MAMLLPIIVISTIVISAAADSYSSSPPPYEVKRLQGQGVQAASKEEMQPVKTLEGQGVPLDQAEAITAAAITNQLPKEEMQAEANLSKIKAKLQNSQVKTLEGQGVPLDQAEAITTAAITNQSFLPKEEMQAEANLSKIKAKLQNSQANDDKWNVNGATGQSLDFKLRQAETNRMNITVNPNGSADFKTITEAISSIPAPNSRRVVVFIAPGIYREKIVIPEDLHFITFLGDATKKPTITGSDKASTIGSDGKPLMTFKSATVAVDADYFIAINIIFQNTASPRIGSKNDQAVALRISGDKGAFYNSEFYGFQDTLYDHKGLHYFKDCKIQGSVDFIFGNGKSLYEGCTINSIAENSSFITAQKRSNLTMDSGFSILNSKVTGSGQVYLGRPWGDYSRVIFSFTYMDALVRPQGWTDTMDDRIHHNLTVFYAEYKCSGPGSSFAGRPAWIRRLSDEDAKEFIGVHFIRGETWLQGPSHI